MPQEFRPLMVRQHLGEARAALPELRAASKAMTAQWEVVARTTATMAERRLRDEKRWGATVEELRATRTVRP